MEQEQYCIKNRSILKNLTNQHIWIANQHDVDTYKEMEDVIVIAILSDEYFDKIQKLEHLLQQAAQYLTLFTTEANKFVLSEVPPDKFFQVQGDVKQLIAYIIMYLQQDMLWKCGEKEDALQSEIQFMEPSPESYDGEKASPYLFDEAGQFAKVKWEQPPGLHFKKPWHKK